MAVRWSTGPSKNPWIWCWWKSMETTRSVPAATIKFAISFAPIATLEAAGTLYVEVAGETLTVEWVPGVRSALNSRSIADAQERGSARVTNAAGELVAFDTPFWFAVAAFRLDAQIVGQ